MPHSKHRKRANTKRFTRRMALRRVGGVGAMAALVPVFQACGTDDEPDEVSMAPDDETATVPVTTLSPIAMPAGAAGATPDAAPEDTGEPETHLVEMNDDLDFVPQELTLRVGDTVVWRTVGAVPHTATCDPEEAQNPEEHVQLPEGAETWNSGTVGQGDEYERTFEVPGEYTYFCIPHEANDMVGYLTVEE